MLSVDQALAKVLEHVVPCSTTQSPLDDALALVLAEDVTSDVDSPPHNKAMVDGYAVRMADLARGDVELEILEEVTAGDVPTRVIRDGSATRIMTGAPVPEGTEAVVMIERTQLKGDQRVAIEAHEIRSGANIMLLGTSLRKGAVVKARGEVIRPIDVGLLSEVGRTSVEIVRRPLVAVLSTGNELVTPDQVPQPGQIRNSNGPMLAAAATEARAVPTELGIARDTEPELRAAIGKGLEADVLLLSGGVSAGVLDLTPRVLEESGVEEIFHKVCLKPGKPLWFGVKKTENGRCLVFGLPGNPISSYVCFHLFVRPALGQMLGNTSSQTGCVQATLTAEFRQRGNRPTCHPARLRYEGGKAVVEPVVWHGSADMAGFVAGNALAQFPAGSRTFEAGEGIEVLPLP